MLTVSTSPPGSVPVSASLNCLVAEQSCIQEQSCMVLYRLLEYCAAEEAVSPLGSDARLECLEAQNSLQHYRPLQVCKCQRGSRREEHCLRVYWTVRFAGGFKRGIYVCVLSEIWDSQLCSPCNEALSCCFSIWWVWSVSIWRTAGKSGEKHWDVTHGLHHGRYCSYHKYLKVWHINHRFHSLITTLFSSWWPPASSLAVDGQNQCLKAAQDCGLYEKCGSLRSEYVVACTKRATASDNSCNRQKCHKALRRFLERVPEEYSFALLFCPCSDTLCGERRRKTIVPSCSYEENSRGEERVGKPNCLSLQNYCSRDELCR